MNNLNDLLSGLNALDDLLPERLGLYALDEVARDLEINVSLQQCLPHFPEGIARVGLADFAQAPQVPESAFKLAA